MATDTPNQMDFGTRAGNLVDKYKYPVAFLVAFLGLWTLGVRVYAVPTYVLPAPAEIILSFQGELGSLAGHARVTLIEAILGWVLGNAIGISLGAVMAEFNTLKRSIYPYMVILRSLPVIAFAPLLIIWMGINQGPIIAAATITTFFPSLVNSIAGFSSTDKLTKELMHSLNASRWQVFRKVKLYNALPYIFSALRISVALTFVGAVVGEWLAGNEGLGYLILVANNQLSTLLLFRALLIIGLCSTVWFGLLVFVESYLIDWENQSSGGATR
ncbi:ABC transporter permease [Halomicroarcula sp. GCM10025709]|uniref:ABC transporter permease n=1 Tax=Haloarcula TaxID=2237 RepID=UPI0024C2F8DA|nr:ABC transporter permease [Halomicroarcula sp. YJ-61-S]